MSTIVHCIYCLEVLSAKLEGRVPVELSQIETSWRRYVELAEGQHHSEHEKKKSLPSERSLEIPSRGTVSSSSSPATLSRSSSSHAASSSSSSRTSVSVQTPAEEFQYPLFVTWNIIRKSGTRSLRGCIGTFDAQPLRTGLKNYALTSALDDNRFSPISLSELPSLSCGVTLLTDFETVASPMDWEIGKHGLRISFVYKSRPYGATYLPDVAKEQGWTKVETMISLMRKAGWNGRQEDWHKVLNLTVTRYQGLATYTDYVEWRKWRDWFSGEYTLAAYIMKDN